MRQLKNRLKRGPSRTRRRSPERDRDTERRILDAAHAVFVRRGTAGARMQEIAAEADVNQALLHYYFRSKDRLSQAAFERAAFPFLPKAIQVPASHPEVEGKGSPNIQLGLEHPA